MPTAVFYPGESEARSRRARAVPVRPRRDRGLCRRHRRPADALDEEHPRQLVAAADDRRRRRPRRALRRHRRDIPAPSALARPGRPSGQRSSAPCSAGRSTSSTTTRARDAEAEAALRSAAASAGFREIVLQYEPIAAAFDHEQSVAREETVLVADIGGGTSDFSLVRVGPDRKDAVDRRCDILASHGVHIAGTDFDRRLELASILPLLGHGAFGPSVDGAPPREAPSAVYFDLATWHLINTVYNAQRVVELRGMRSFYADPELHRRLMTVVDAAPRPRPRRPRGGGEDRGRRRRRGCDRPRPGRAGARDPARRARPPPRPRRRSRPHRRSGADDGRAGRPRPGGRRRPLPHGRLDRARAPERSPAAGVRRRARRRRRPLRERRDRSCSLRAAPLRRARPTLTQNPPAQSPSTAAIACAVASTLPRFRPATHMRPDRTR